MARVIKSTMKETKKSAMKSIVKSVKKDGKENKNKKIIVTTALPYANGSIHIGYLLEAIQADIYVKYSKLLGKNILYVCASDMHGTPIEVNAAKARMKPEAFAEKYWKEHIEDLNSFLIRYDNYHKTHSPENQELAEYFFKELKRKNLIYLKEIDIIYCEKCQRSLPDRYVKGTCYLCGAADQYGDICESCGSALKGTNLLKPHCVLCGATPIIKQSSHYFFKLSEFTTKLKKWLNAKDSDLQPELKNWLSGWLKNKLEDWCISRDAPYFGFEIPGSKAETGETKYFYVWLDAPIGYISSTKNYCDKQNEKDKEKGKRKGTNECTWEDYWKHGEIHHFIGKDISYFHFLFWPAMLMAMEIPLPKLTVHGFITVDGQKMSKSRGTFFTAKDFLKLYSPEALRFYYASHLDRKVVDIDLNFADFKSVINNVLVGNLGNFCYRTLTFAETNYPVIGKSADNKALTKAVLVLTEKIKQNYLELDFKTAIKNILQIADLGNAYFQKAEPWKNKEAPESKEAVAWCVNLTRNLAILVSPILPEFSNKIYGALGEENKKNIKETKNDKKDETKLDWEDLSFAWKGKVKKVSMLVEKIEKLPEKNKFPLQLVVGQIETVTAHPQADNLYLMKVDLGSGLGKKQVVAGLKKYFSEKQLVGRKAVFCTNLKPAKLRGELSEAMILAADDGKKVALLDVDETPVGEAVKFEGLENSAKEITFEEFLKLTIEVNAGNVFYTRKKLVSEVEAVSVAEVRDGAKVR